MSRFATLREVTLEPISWNPLTAVTDTPFQYIDIGSVDASQKRIVGASSVLPTSAPSRARQLVESGDVLISSVRPNLNAVAVVPDSLDGATASTGFVVLRPKRQLIDSRYLFHWVRGDQFVTAMVARSTGANYPAVTESVVRDSVVPLPSLEEQRHIATILDKADDIRAKQQGRLGTLRNVLRSAFLEVAGPAAHAYRKWSETSIEELALNPKAIRSGPFGSALHHKEFVDEGVPVLGIDNAVKNRFAWDQRRYVTQSVFERLRRFIVKPGDVLVTIMGTTGRSAVVPDDIGVAISTKHLAVISLDRQRVVPLFLSQAIQHDPSIAGQVHAANRGAIMSGLNLGVIRKLRIRLPPIEVQRRLEQIVLKTFYLADIAEKAALTAGHLRGSLQNRFFAPTR